MSYLTIFGSVAGVAGFAGQSPKKSPGTCRSAAKPQTGRLSILAVRRLAMNRHVIVAAVLLGSALAVLSGRPAAAITAQQKMVTCKFGADHPEGGGPKLVGKERAHFIARCMSNKNDPSGPAIGTPGGPAAPKG
jgi:hypothetical protein